MAPTATLLLLLLLAAAAAADEGGDNGSSRAGHGCRWVRSLLRAEHNVRRQRLLPRGSVVDAVVGNEIRNTCDNNACMHLLIILHARVTTIYMCYFYAHAVNMHAHRSSGTSICGLAQYVRVWNFWHAHNVNIFFFFFTECILIHRSYVYISCMRASSSSYFSVASSP